MGAAIRVKGDTRHTVDIKALNGGKLSKYMKFEAQNVTIKSTELQAYAEDNWQLTATL